MTNNIVTVDGAYLFQDYLAAHRLNRQRPQIGLRSASILIGAVLVFLGVGILGQVAPLNIAAGAFFVLWGIFLSEQVFRLQVKRRWEQYPAMRNGSLALSLRADGVSSIDDEGNPIVSKWEKFVKWKEGDDIFLLYVSPHLWLSIPKRLLQSPDVEVVRRLLSTHISIAG